MAVKATFLPARRTLSRTNRKDSIMPAFTRETTLRDLVAHHPQARHVLERRHVDYCCGGDRPLGQAAEAAGVDYDLLAGELARALDRPRKGADDRDWLHAPAGDLVDHIEQRHHAFMRRMLPAIVELIGKVLKAHADRHGEMLRKLQFTFHELKEEIRLHLMKEEQILFPLIRQMEAAAEGRGQVPENHCGTVENPIRQMEHEHDNAGDALARLREMTGDYTLPEDACMSMKALYEDLQAVEADLHEHIHLENNILFPKAVELEHKVCAV
jgi:regulator of cell morphogenesis and NO signaling